MQTKSRQLPSAQRLPVQWRGHNFRLAVLRPGFSGRRPDGNTKPPRARFRSFALLAPCLLLALLAAGCTTPAVRQQRLVAKANMTFSAAAAFQYNSSRLLGQQATGLAGAGGPQNSGCTSCR